MIAEKIKSRDEILKLLSAGRTGKVIGFTSGSFDILHAGHVDYLAKAKSQCDILIVGVNSDASVKAYKDELRPIVAEQQRMKVVAALASADYVFRFDELNNNQNIEILKPDIYFKAGDYSKDKLSSAKLIEAYGGRVELIEVVEELSSSKIINKILTVYSAQDQNYIRKTNPPISRAVLVDRDGTINKHRDYLFDEEQFELIEGAAEGLKILQDAGYKIVVITNQPGIGFGYFEMEQLFRVNKKMLKLLSAAGVVVHKIYFSPYTKADNTTCRKPGIALAERARDELNLDLTKCFMIGDSSMDIAMGNKAGCRTVLVQTGNAGGDKLYDCQPDFTSANLFDAAGLICELK